MSDQVAGLQVGEVGIEIVLDTDLDLTPFISFEILARRPDGVERTWTAVLSGPATDGKIAYTTVLGDLDRAGVWVFQARVTDASGAMLIGEAVKVRVKALFEV